MAELCPPHYDRPRLETFKLSKYIVEVTTEKIEPPEYLREIALSTESVNFGMVLQCNQEAIRQRKEMLEERKNSLLRENSEKIVLPKLKSFKINPLKLNDWPSAEELGMDIPQYTAFQSAITQELAIVQGPPGISLLQFTVYSLHLLLF